MVWVTFRRTGGGSPPGMLRGVVLWHSGSAPGVGAGRDRPRSGGARRHIRPHGETNHEDALASLCLDTGGHPCPDRHLARRGAARLGRGERRRHLGVDVPRPGRRPAVRERRVHRADEHRVEHGRRGRLVLHQRHHPRHGRPGAAGRADRARRGRASSGPTTPRCSRRKYGFAADFSYAGTSLSNGGEQVTLVDASASTVDDVTYDDAAPWPVAPDGGGPSLEVSDLTADNADPANWHASSVDFGTPRQPNTSPPLALSGETVTACGARPGPERADLGVGADVGSTITLTYKVMYGSEVVLPMLDDAASPGGAGDGMYAATVPGAAAGQMVRYRIAAAKAGLAAAYLPVGDSAPLRRLRRPRPGAGIPRSTPSCSGSCRTRTTRTCSPTTAATTSPRRRDVLLERRVPRQRGDEDQGPDDTASTPRSSGTSSCRPATPSTSGPGVRLPGQAVRPREQRHSRSRRSGLGDDRRVRRPDAPEQTMRLSATEPSSASSASSRPTTRCGAPPGATRTRRSTRSRPRA